MKLNLRAQIFIALLLFTFFFAAVLQFNIHNLNEVQVYDNNLSLAKNVTAKTDDLERRASIYSNRAPRDFESYNRDVALFFPLLQSDLKELNIQMESLNEVKYAEQDVKGLQEHYQTFMAGFKEKMGDEADPRLEWGTEFLAKEAPLLKQAADGLKAKFIQEKDERNATAKRLVNISWIAGLAFTLLMLLWFWKRIANRIGKAAESCTLVAEGEFGTRIEEKSNDEIGQFANAFNSLSARTRVVLGVIDKLPENANRLEAFNTVWNESHNFLGQQWQGMFAVDTGLQTATLEAYKQEGSASFSKAGTEFPINEIASTLNLEDKDYAIWEDIRKHTLNPKQSQLIRRLSIQNLRTVVFVLMRNEANQPHRLLAFAWDGANAESVGVASFLGSLTRFLGKTLA